MSKHYDKAYFERWYHDPESAINAPDDVARKVALAVAATEYYLGRPVANVLDVGCGEGNWRAPLLALRPDVAYRGLDASEYVVSRFGAERNIGLATFGALQHLRFEAPFDLVICSNLLHYVGDEEVVDGLSGLDEQLAGLAFIEVYTSDDDVYGDDDDYRARSPDWYRHAFRDAGLTSVGSQLYAGSALSVDLLALERSACGDCGQA